jgi:chemotaxis protein histidine kinase CheA
MRSKWMDEPSRQDLFAERSLTLLGSFEYQVLQLRTMSDPIDATFLSRALAVIQSIRMDAADLELATIAAEARVIQTSLQQIAEQEQSPRPEAVRKILQQTHRLRQIIEANTNDSDLPEDRKTTQNAGTDKTPAPKRARPQFTLPPAAKRLEDLMGEILLRLDDCLAVEPKPDDPAPTGDSDLSSPDDEELKIPNDDVIEK